MKRLSKVLHGKAIQSMRSAVTAFNSPQDQGRSTAVLLLLQHSFEMLLKAILVETGVKVFDRKTGRSIGFDAAVRQLQSSSEIKLSDEEAGTLRAIDALRDDEQHWFNEVSEGILFLHARAGVSLFDELLHRGLGDRLAHYLPIRVLPISTEPQQDVVALVDREYTAIRELLQPGRRARDEARARIRTLLALEAHAQEDAKVSNTDVNRVEKGIREGKPRSTVFPQLGSVATHHDGEGPTYKVKFVKADDAMPVRFVGADEDVDAAAVREVDLLKKYHWTASKLADKLGLSGPRAAALRDHLGIDSDAKCTHHARHNSSKLTYYSDNALSRMRDAMKVQDLDEIWQFHRKGRGVSPSRCPQEGCVRELAAPAKS